MFSARIYQERRNKLIADVREGTILIMGNNLVPFNYASNTYKFRQDSNFLYFAGIDLPGLAITIHTGTGKTTLYGNDISVEDAIWTGNQPQMSEWANKSGIEAVKPFSSLVADIKKDAKVHYPPTYPHHRKIFLSEALNLSIDTIDKSYSVALIRAIIKQRSIKADFEVEQIEKSLNESTSIAHIHAMKMAKGGVYEYEIAGEIESLMLQNNSVPAYGIICSVRGETLHNIYYNNKLRKEQLLLVDAGAENSMHYASDITRTTPVGRKFNRQQKDIYSIVLEANKEAIKTIKPGITYQSIHLNAAKLISQRLIELGLMKGEPDDIVAAGAHALFFPHGLGHMMGLDVHDMEDLGEDYVGYDNNTKRIKQFGTAYLRLGRELQTGFVLTVEPGIYFIPNLIDKWRNEKKFEDFINYSKLETYKDFGGIRIEDNILVTKDGYRLLGHPIPKEINEIEAL